MDRRTNSPHDVKARRAIVAAKIRLEHAAVEVPGDALPQPLAADAKSPSSRRAPARVRRRATPARTHAKTASGRKLGLASRPELAQ